MTIERPYMQLSLDALKAKLGASPTNHVLLMEVQHELAFRTTQQAQRLRRDVETLLAGTDSDAIAPNKTTGKAAGGELLSGVTVLPAATPLPNLEARYVALRATFTAEAEILSRWGMTSLAPPPMRSAVFRYWEETLLSSSRQHPLGLDSDDLKGDIEALQNEKRGS